MLKEPEEMKNFYKNIDLNMSNLKHIKTFESFVNEGHLPFNLEKSLKLGGIEFMFDEMRTSEDDDDRFDFLEVYISNHTDTEWVIKVGTTPQGNYLLEIIEDGMVAFTHEYPKNQKAYFDQDCVNSLGFSPELD